MAVDVTPLPARGHARSCCPPSPLGKVDRDRALSVSATAKALADPVRVEILHVLRAVDGEVCQCDLQPLFGISQPTLSHHLKKLHGAGLIEVERRGKWAYYAINEDALEGLRAWVS
jgi:ArsR family transcriptional regulator